MVQLKDISKVYGVRVAVDRLSLEIPRGVCYGLLGPNGAGKTTTISILAGMLSPDSGSVVLDGKPLDVDDRAAKTKIGYVPQELALYEDLSTGENLAFFGSLFHVPPNILPARIERVLEIIGLQDRVKGPVKQFSGGMKRRLNIGLALLHDPELLILDEPTVGVDPQSRNLIFEALEKLTAEGKTILYTTHYMEEIERLCSRVAIMDGGRLICDDSIQNLLTTLPATRTIAIQLASIPELNEVKAIGEEFEYDPSAKALRVRTDAKGSDLLSLLGRVEDQVGPITGVTTERQSLEQLFLHLTGRTIRD